MTVPTLAIVTERLFVEFEVRISLAQITAAVQRARRDLAGSVSEAALPEMVERLARYRLTEHITQAPGRCQPT
jgi:hypothetical protein